MTGVLAELVDVPALSEAIDVIVNPTAPTPRPEHVITDVPMTEAAAEYVTGENAAEIIACYFTPQVTSPKRGSDQLWHIYGDIAMSVMPTGCVVWIGEREWPDEADPKVDLISGRRTRTARGTGGTIPGGFTKSRNGSGAKHSGHRGGHRHPTTVKDLLDRCRAAGLEVEETGKGGHWKISCPEGWTRPRRATSGAVFVSGTTEFRAIAKNTNKILRETGIDVREIDPAAIRRRGRLRTAANESDREMTATLTAPDPTEAEPEEVAPVATSAPGPSPAGRPSAGVVAGRPSAGVTGGTSRSAAEQTADRLRFVAEMRAEGHTDTEIAVAMGISANNLAAFLSIQRTRGHPLAVPARKRYTDPDTGVVTHSGSMTRGTAAITTRPVAAPVATTRPAATPPVYRRDPQPVTEAEITKLLGAVRNLGRLSRTDIVKLFWRRKRRTEIDALIAAVTGTGQARVTTEQRTKFGYATTYVEWVAEPEVEPEVEPEQLPETDTVTVETAAEPVPVAEVAGTVEPESPAVSFEEAQQLVAGIVADRDQAIAEGALVIGELVAETTGPEPELPGTAVEVEPERIDATPEVDPATVPDTVVEDAPDDPAAEPESAITVADLRADLARRRQEAPSEAQDGPGDPDVVEPVSEAAEDHSEPLSGPGGRPARYATTCAVCSEDIRLGALIVPVRHKWQHARHEQGPQATPVAGHRSTGSVMPTAVTVLEAALRRVGVADPELVARNLRHELADTGWKLRLEAAL